MFFNEHDTTPYDSTADTIKHKNKVEDIIQWLVNALVERASHHDASKLREPEKAKLDEQTPSLAGNTYGSDQYKQSVALIRSKHHNANNAHHPEHHENGIHDMTLVDIVEMFCDWQAATERHADGNIMESIDINQGRFGFSDDLRDIFRNTAKLLVEKGGRGRIAVQPLFPSKK
jgi:hypothetical protein